MELVIEDVRWDGVTLYFNNPYLLKIEKDKSGSLWIASDPSIDLYVFADDIDQLRQEIAEWFIVSYRSYVVGRVQYQLNERAREVGRVLDTIIKKEP